MAEGAADRTESATPRRREQARERGQVVRSPEVSPVAELLLAITLVSWGAPTVLARSRALVGGWLAAVGPIGASPDGGFGMMRALVAHSLMDMGGLVLPFALAAAVVGGGSVLAQVGWNMNPALLVPDLNRLNPGNGLRRIFSPDGAMNLVKSVAKIAVAFTIAYHVVRHLGVQAVATPAMTPAEILRFAAAGLRRLFLSLALALTVLGALDFLWQRRRYEQSLKMSRQEVKEEHKETEGDPQVKVRFRRAHREIAKRRMLSEVRRADVVLTNPIHVAVALRYRAPEMGAPQVIAKGAGEMAQRIKDAARAAGVPIVERRALARALFRSVKLGYEVPPALYRAVAEILAYIYSLRSAVAGEAR
jgi:flagellar biosynthetic protein FlhB